MVRRQITNNVSVNLCFSHFITRLSYTGCDVRVKITPKSSVLMSNVSVLVRPLQYVTHFNFNRSVAATIGG